MFKKNRRNTIISFLFLLPSIIGITIFYIYPLFEMLLSSFAVNEFEQVSFGLVNYTSLLKNDSFRLAFENSLFFLIISVPIILLLSFLLGITMQKSIYFRGILTSAMILPMIIPVIVVVSFFTTLFGNQGMINQVLEWLHLGSFDWEYSSARRIIVVVIYVWKNIGYNTILILAGLTMIPKEYYEVAEVEGANGFEKFRYITGIYSTPTLFFVFIISMINSFKVFKEIYAMDGAYPMQELYMMQHYINNLFSKASYSRLITATLIFTIFLAIIILIIFYLQKRILKKIEDV